MADQTKINEVDRLLNVQYGIGLADGIDEAMVERDLNDGEDPQAIVDDIAEKHMLKKINRADSNWN